MPAEPVEDLVQPEFAPQRTHGKHGALVPGLDGTDLLADDEVRCCLTPTEDADRRIQMLGQHVFASKIAHDTLLGAAVFPVRLHAAEVFVDLPLGAASPNRPEIDLLSRSLSRLLQGLEAGIIPRQWFRALVLETRAH